jgi:ribonuclease P protein component
VLGPDQRLRRADDFAIVIRRGRRVGRNGLVVHVLTPGAAGTAAGVTSRAGFVIGKAVGGAVVRNTVRRRLRHLLRAELPRLAPGTDVVVRALPEAADRSFDELSAHLRDAIAVASRPRGAGERRSTNG